MAGRPRKLNKKLEEKILELLADGLTIRQVFEKPEIDYTWQSFRNELVKSDEYPDRLDLPAIADGKYKGVIGIGGLVLMRCPVEVKEDRDEYFRNLTNDKTAAIESDLHKEEHPSMPIHQERQSRVTFGGKKS